MLIKKDIIATVAYFDMFDYPVTQAEIHLFLQRSCRPEQVTSALQELAAESLLHRVDEFYSLRNDVSLVEKRRTENRKALQMMKTANKVSALISAFPYVRCVTISGSLSKGVANDKADIDFFIVCAKNRLWIGRTLLILFRKLACLINKQHFFCMNYFVDEAALEIEEKNIYTAMEIVTLIPMRGRQSFEQFRKANTWTGSYFPNHDAVKPCLVENKASVAKKAFEWIFNHNLFNSLEHYLQHVTEKRYQKKELSEKRNLHGIIMSMKASEHYSKHNPVRSQFVLLSKYQSKVQELFVRMGNAIAVFEE